MLRRAGFGLYLATPYPNTGNDSMPRGNLSVLFARRGPRGPGPGVQFADRLARRRTTVRELARRVLKRCKSRGTDRFVVFIFGPSLDSTTQTTTPELRSKAEQARQNRIKKTTRLARELKK